MRKMTEEETRRTNGEPGGEQTPAAEQALEKPAEGAEADPAEPEDGAAKENGGAQARIAALEGQLRQAQCRLAAFAAGVAPELVDDAVTLAVQAARAAGEETEASLAEAMEQVLQRHPTWKAERRRAGGFRLGADPGEPRGPAPARDDRKRWNRFR